MSCLLRFPGAAPVFAAFLSAAITFANGAQAPDGFLHASGVKVVDAANAEVVLRGVNLGSWLSPEPWMMGSPDLSRYAGGDDYDKLNAALVDVLAWDTGLAARALGAMRSNFVTSADIVFLKQGFNNVRVPFHYKLFFEVTNPAAAYPANGYDIDTGFNYFDRLLSWCATNAIYVIPVMHGVPGGQDYAVAGNVYANAPNRALFLHVWQRIASRYATNFWIGGYDLIDEPVNSADSTGLIPGTLLSAVYADARDALRAADTNHMLICEGDARATALDRINTTGWTDDNVCYSDHRYGDALPFDTSRKSVAVGQNVPIWMGEFGYNSTHWINFAITNLERPETLTANSRTATIGEGWCYWAYKTPQFCALVESPQRIEWQALKAYWDNSIGAPPVAIAFNYLLASAQATAFSNCLVHPEVLDALRRPNSSFASQRVAVRPGLTIPGRIAAVDFDMGADGIAFHDSVYDDEAGAGPGGRAWNESWFGRDDGVDAAPCLDESALLKIGWIDAGEWQRYSITSVPGTYNLNIRYGGGGQMHVLINGVNVSGPVTLPNTGATDKYFNFCVSNVGVTASGAATLELACDTGGYDLVWVEFQPVNAAPLPPGNLSAAAGDGAVALTWVPATGATAYSVRRATTSGGPYTTVGSTTSSSFAETGLTNDTIYFYDVASVNAAGASAPTAEVSVTPAPSPVSGAWFSRDIGIARFWNGDAAEIGFPGSTAVTNGVWTVRGAGTDLWGKSDSLHYAFRPVAGDCAIIARLNSVQNTHPSAKAGLMIRETLQFDSAYFGLMQTPANGVQTLFRATTGADTANPYTSGVTAPQWLKLERVGNSFTAYKSSDGETWVPLQNTHTLLMSSNVYIGLGVTSRDRFKLNASAFEFLRVEAQLPAAPEPVSASATASQVRLEWPAVAGASSYLVKRSSSTNGPFATLATGLAGTSFVDDAVVSGVTYFYVVSGFNLNGEGTNSVPVAATTFSGSLPSPQVSASWDAPGTHLRLTWPAWATNFDIYMTTNLAPPVVWKPATNASITVATNVTATLPLDGSQAFFRLQGR